MASASRLPSALPRRPTATCLSTTTTTTTTIATQPNSPGRTAAAAATPFSRTPVRHATMIRRPRRPYAFTQLVQLSDGSTYTQRTTSPHALYRSSKDTRNHVLWQPSEKSLRNVEVDEAGKLAAFRERFGRGWDAEAGGGGGGGGGGDKGEQGGGGVGGGEAGAAAAAAGAGATGGSSSSRSATGDALGDLISGYSKAEDEIKEKAPAKKKK